MKTNVVPAIIIAAAILAVAFIARTSSAAQVQAFLDQVESSVQRKDADGKTQLSRITAGLSRSVSDGVKAGFQGSQNDDSRKELDVRPKLVIKEVKLVPGRMKNQERVVGLIRNDSTETVRNVTLNVVYKDAQGGLADVSPNSYVQGILKPGDQLGFEAQRELGGFQEKDDVLAQRKSASVVATVSGFSIAK